MIIPLDIHTHRVPLPLESAIQNRYPETFDEKAEGWFSVGFHPWRIEDYQKHYPWEELHRFLSLPQVLAVGEAGIDKICGVPLDEQERVFIHQAETAEEIGKPLIIHMVKSADEMVRIRKQMRPSVPWIIHGFRGKPAQAQQLLSHNFCLSFGALYHPESLKLTPLSRLFLETDEADISIESLIEKAAEIKGIDFEEMKQILMNNVNNTFSCVRGDK